MTTLYEGAFAKVNLTLDVLGKRPDGYHDLKSIMQTISVRDDIEIDLDTGADCSAAGSDPLCSDAAEAPKRRRGSCCGRSVLSG